MEIQQTKSYSKFNTITGNRAVNLTKIEKIAADIEAGFNMLPYCPIIVSEQNGKFNIIDGQHRYQVSVTTKQPVYYVVCNTLTLKQIAMLNSRGDKWKATDFLNCYINLGIEDYKVLKDFMTKNKLNIKIAIDLLMFYKHHENTSTDIFQSGEFKVKFLKESGDLIKLIDDVFAIYAFSHDRYLIGAVQQLIKLGKCDFEKLKQKISMAPNMLDKHSDVKSYIYNIERIYNFKNSIREVIY